MTAPTKSTRDLLLEGWHWRDMAWKRTDEKRVFEWVDAMNVLLDKYLDERPELRWTMSDSAAG